MTEPEKRTIVWCGLGVLAFGLASAVLGVMQLLVPSIVCAVLAALLGVIPIVMQHNSTSLQVVAVVGSDEKVWKGFGNTLVATTAAPTDPKPRRTGRATRIGQTRGYELTNGRWEVRVGWRRRLAGWVQKGSGDSEGRDWWVKDRSGLWTQYSTEEGAYTYLQASRAA